MNLSWPTYRPH